MAVEIEWIDSISPAATGNKIYRDTVPSTGEVEIADIVNGVQFYSDGTVAEGTQYKFEVQAHDGAGDETTQEVEGENMDYITTEASGPVVDPNDVFPQDNAASMTDLNSLGSFVNSGTGTMVLSTDTSVSTNCIHQVSTDGSYDRITISFDVTAGNYNLKYDYKSVNFTSQNFDISGWVYYSNDLTSQVWTSVETGFNPASAGTITFTIYAAVSGAIGDELFIDNIEFIKEV